MQEVLDEFEKHDLSKYKEVIFCGYGEPLNASNAEEYLKITRSKFGIESYKALLKFAVSCQKHLKEVRLTVVDVIGEAEIKKCRETCEKYNLNFKVRQFI